MRFFFFNDTATTEIYTLSLHDALPIYHPLQTSPQSFRVCLLPGEAVHDPRTDAPVEARRNRVARERALARMRECGMRSEEHTSELQSRQYLVCRLLLEKKNISVTNLCI